MQKKYIITAGIIILAVVMVLFVSCGGEETEKFAIDSGGTLENGSISVIKEAAKGDTVTITAKPDDYCGLSSVTVKGTKTDQEVTLSGTGTERTFTMPGEPVKITVVFLQLRQVTIGKQYNRGEVFGEDGKSTVFFAMAGETVTLIGVPDEGYYLYLLRVVKTDSEEEIPVSEVPGNINARTFVMVDEMVSTPHGGRGEAYDGAIFKELP